MSVDNEISLYKDTVDAILNEALFLISRISPSEWNEQHRIMTNSAVNGMFKYSNSPYTREIVDFFSPENPNHTLAAKKGAQIGFTTAVVEAAIAWIISENPDHILFLVGHEDVFPDAVAKVDRVLENTGIRARGLIQAATIRNRNSKSGDTDKLKEFRGGSLRMGLTNLKSVIQYSVRYGFIDDFDAMQGETENEGGVVPLIEQRFAAYGSRRKVAFISTPKLKRSSNIEKVFLKGDQRRYYLPCPCCGMEISLFWECQVKFGNEAAGMTWKLDATGRLIEDSVGYICQECGGFFDDRKKTQLLIDGKWKPTCEPSEPGYVSYHISSLYAPSYMFGWVKYVRQYLDANPVGKARDESLWKVFCNIVLGEPYEEPGESVKISELKRNIRPYTAGIVPDKLCASDGNGYIVLLTVGADCNGTLDDARLDYEVSAWSSLNQRYSVTHGSIGTFIPREGKVKSDRVKFTYRKPGLDEETGEIIENSVWPEFDKVLSNIFLSDTGRRLRVTYSAVDSGYLTDYVYSYVDNSRFDVSCVKGKGEDTFLNPDTDRKLFKKSVKKSNLYIVEVNLLKDDLATWLKLKWNHRAGEGQPRGFINFPTPADGKYGDINYFEHFAAEEKKFNKTGFCWVKKSSASQNHMFDCSQYAFIAREILVQKLLESAKKPGGSWEDFIALIEG